MIYALLAGLAAAAIIWQVRHYRLAWNPAAWPRTMPFEKQVKLTKAFLKHDGWQMLEANPPMNIFVLGRRNGAWLAMMVHGGEGTLSLPTLMKDCISKHAGKNTVLGILSQDALLPEFQEEADRNAIYVISPSELPNVEAHIRRTAVRQREMKTQELAAAMPPGMDQKSLV